MANKERNKRSARKARSAQRAELESANEQLEGAVSKSTRDQLIKVQKDRAKAAQRPTMLSKISDYFRSVGSEMRRVVWPSRKELRDYSIGVLIMLVIFGIAIWLVDTGVVLILQGLSGLKG